MARFGKGLVTLLVVIAAGVSGDGRAGTGTVPLAENFSRAELVGTVLVTVTGGTLFVLNDSLAQHMGDPWIGDPGPLDRWVTDALYRGPDAGSWLGGVPDLTGATLGPAVAVLFYVGNGATDLVRGTGWTGNPNAVHEMVAFAEAFGATTTLTFTTKLVVGRERPMYALDREPGAEPEPDAYQSFFSGHTSSAFCIAAFAARDLGDWLVSGPLQEAGGISRTLVGRVLPGLVLYGAATVVGVSRIVDQKHYLSDVLTGALVGTAIANGVYARHFDRTGAPRRHATPAITWRVGPGVLEVSGRF